jgi:hypothetical protein
MPGFLVNTLAQVKCAHGGMATPAAGFPRVQVMGQPVVLITAPYKIAGCGLPPPPGANGPCLSGQFPVGSTRVLANGLSIVLIDSKAPCVPTGTPLLVAFTQTRVAAI